MEDRIERILFICQYLGMTKRELTPESNEKIDELFNLAMHYAEWGKDE